MNQEEIMQQLQAAVALHNQGELDQAEAIYRGVLAVDANNFYALNFYGCILRSKGQLYDASLLLQRAVSLKAGDMGAQYNLGNVFRDLGDFGSSFIHYKAALGIVPSHAQALYAFANTCAALGDLATSIESYRKAIEVKPDFEEAYLNLGNVLQKEGEVEEAIASYRKAIKVKPDFAAAKKALMQCQGSNGIREQVTVEAYREKMEGNDEAGILIAAYPSFEAIPSNRRSVNLWIEDKNESYFGGEMFGSVFVDLPWVKAKSFAEISSLYIPSAGDEYLDAVDVYRSQNKTLQIRMFQAPVISSLLESVARKKSGPIEVIDVGGWSGNALFLAGFNDSWDVVKTWSVVETSAVCVPAREQLPGLLEGLPEGSGGQRNLPKLSFEELDSFYADTGKNADLIYSCGALFYDSQFTDHLDSLISRGASVVFLHSQPYLASSNPNLNVCEITPHRDGGVSFLCSQKFLSEMAASIAKKYGYSFKMWSEYVEPKLVFWQPQEGDKVLPKEVKEDAKPLLMKVCSIRFDKLLE